MKRKNKLRIANLKRIKIKTKVWALSKDRSEVN